MVSTRSVAVVPSGSSPVRRSPTTGGHEHRERLAEHGRLGLDAADAPAEHAEPVDHGGVRVGAHQGVGEGLAVVGGEHHPGQVLEVDLVADAGPRRHDAEAVEGLLGPAQQLVALDVALVLDVDVGRRRTSARPEDSAMTEWSMTSSTGTSGLIAGGVAAQLARASRMAARSTTPGTPVKSCMSTRSGVKAISAASEPPTPGARVARPTGHGLDVGGVDLAPVLVAEQVLEQDLHGVGQPGDVEPVGEGVEPVDLEVPSPTGRSPGRRSCRGRWGSGHAPILPRRGPRRNRPGGSGAGAVPADGQGDEDDQEPDRPGQRAGRPRSRAPTVPVEPAPP